MVENVYGVIYLIINNVNGKIYVGQTTRDFDTRYSSNKWYNHVSNEHLYNSVQKYGVDSFTVVKQFDVAYNQDELNALEDLYICMYETMNPKHGYNKRRGGDNRKASEETKEKLSKVAKERVGDKNPFFGKHHTQEAIDKGRQKQKQNYENGYTNPFKGKTHTEETKTKIGEAIKNSANYKNYLENGGREAIRNRCKNLSANQYGKDNPRARAVYSPTLNMKFDTVKEAEAFIGKQGVGKCCNPNYKNKTCGQTEDGVRIVWMYYDEWEAICNATSEQ